MYRIRKKAIVSLALGFNEEKKPPERSKEGEPFGLGLGLIMIIKGFLSPVILLISNSSNCAVCVLIAQVAMVDKTE